MTNRATGTTHPSAPESTVLSPPLALHFVYPPEVGRLHIDLEPQLEIGREAGSDHPATTGSGGSGTYAVVPHATVSRRHASIGESIGSIPALVDRGGRNGTFVNGRPVQGSAPLLRHTVVRFGDVLAVVDERAPSLEDDPVIPGRSPAMARVRAALAGVAPDRAPLLIAGETGTGKEVVATEVHTKSGRRGPLLKFNCAELSPELVESQLFGHERGAYTGATSAQVGLFVAADRGTLFLDEIAEIPLELQAKLLRALQEGEVRPLGSTRTVHVDVRVVCATNVTLLDRVDAGHFRRDLYARLSYLELDLPPLRERRQDILLWIEHFRERWCRERDAKIPLSFRPPVVERLLTWSWPDNLRGLNRLVHRLLASGASGEVGARAVREAMPELFSGASSTSSSDAPDEPIFRQPSERPSREDFLAVYQSTGRNVRATAKHFGRDRKQVYRWLDQFGIERRPNDDDA